jgi:hypothetical protein
MAITIDSYSFGKISVNGMIYGSDLVIYPDRVDDKWWRKEGHLLQIEDIKDIFTYKPGILVVGQGLQGLMKVDTKVADLCLNNRIELIVLPTPQAVKYYNELNKKEPLAIAALHLTC